MIVDNGSGWENSEELPGEELARYVQLSERIPGWTRGPEAQAMALACLETPENAVVVEIGSFFGCGTVLLAGARKIRGSGRIHCVDPFDGSGDEFSVPHYQAIILAFSGRSQREHFEANLEMAGVSGWVEVHQGLAHEISSGWTLPIDLLILDGDQSPEGARLAYDCWSPWLRTGGVIALHNSNEREYNSGHEGHSLLVTQEISWPEYDDGRCVGSTTFARKRA
jgi:MMP 1-O-methyltransferase